MLRLTTFWTFPREFSPLRLFLLYRPLESTSVVEQPEPVVSGKAAETLLGIGLKMAEGTIKRLTDKGFGFIDTGTDQDMFFHNSNLEGVSYEQLHEGQRVSFTEGQGPKGQQATGGEGDGRSMYPT